MFHFSWLLTKLLITVELSLRLTLTIALLVDDERNSHHYAHFKMTCPPSYIVYTNMVREQQILCSAATGIVRKKAFFRPSPENQ